MKLSILFAGIITCIAASSHGAWAGDPSSKPALAVTGDQADAAKTRTAADGGDPAAMFHLGELYEHGRGVPQDYAEAMKWYRKAADAGNADAVNDVGYLYAHALSVPQDYAEAMVWYRKAADGGDANAMDSIGTMYQQGRGVAADPVEAERWFDREAAARR